MKTKPKMKQNKSADSFEHLLESTNTSKWTPYLITCCLIACTASLQFGFNIGSANQPAQIIQNFFGQISYPKIYKERYLDKKESYQLYFKYLDETLNTDSFYFYFKQNMHKINKLKETNITIDVYEELFKDKTDFEIKSKMENLLKQVEENNMWLWTLLNCLFVIGGMFGSFFSKQVVDYFGRKNGFIFHNIFTISGCCLTYYAPQFKSPLYVLISRFLFGIQGGIMSGLIPTYLNEISPFCLRGSTGVLNQLFITIGILIAQTLGFRAFLGNNKNWNLLLALPIIPSVIGSILFALFCPESPIILLNNKNENGCRAALRKLRNTLNVSDEMVQMSLEAKQSKSEVMSMIDLFKTVELRGPLYSSLFLNMAQQFCGISAIFSYSESIFRSANIQDSYIQYAVFTTGFANVISTLVAVLLIERLGRKPLLVYPMIAMVVNFLILTFCLLHKKESILYSYISIICIIMFIICFAVGLGPVPFIYSVECFEQENRGAGLAVSMFANWVSGLILTLVFPYLNEFISDYVFLVFAIIIAGCAYLIHSKVPETKDLNSDEILEYFTGKRTKKI